MNKKVVITSAIVILCLIVAIPAFMFTHNSKNNNDSFAEKSSSKVVKSSDNVSVSKSSSNEPKESLDARKKEVETNPSGNTATDKRTDDKGTTESTSVSEKDIATAGETGEHSEKVYDVKVKDTTVTAEDIANARKTLQDAGINDGVYSDLDIAKVIKAASDKSLDIVTVVKDGKF